MAKAVDGGWVLNGSKMFITNGVRADYVVLAAQDDAEGGHGGISFFLVDTDQPGYEASKIEKLGWHASDTGAHRAHRRRSSRRRTCSASSTAASS